MASYGCWDCGSEVPPFQGSCAVCGWPAPPPRRRRRLPRILLIGFLAGFVVVGAVYATSRAAVPAMSQVWSTEGGHRWVRAHRFPKSRSLCGNVFMCENCGARASGALGTYYCPRPADTRR
jgi:hypothetical protein